MVIEQWTGFYNELENDIEQFTMQLIVLHQEITLSKIMPLLGLFALYVIDLIVFNKTQVKVNVQKTGNTQSACLCTLENSSTSVDATIFWSGNEESGIPLEGWKKTSY